jgi:hypothetical protein
MTTSGYKGFVFTEINPTSTTTSITMLYSYNFDDVPQTYVLGPATILPNAVPVPPPGTPTTPPDAYYSATLTEVVTVTETVRTSSSTARPSCEFHTVAILFIITTTLVMAPRVSRKSNAPFEFDSAYHERCPLIDQTRMVTLNGHDNRYGLTLLRPGRT